MSYQLLQMQGRIKRGATTFFGASFREDYKYRTSTNFPFEVSKIGDLNTKEVTVFDYFDRWTYHQYVNRFEAEESRLKKLIEYYEEKYKKYLAETSRFKHYQKKSKHKNHKFKGYNSVDGTKTKFLLQKYKRELETLSEVHPEWLI